MSGPKFSVVIPAYNAAQTLRSTVASVMAQSDQDFDIVIVDDGSTDETLRAALNVATLERRIRVVSQPNCGVSATRNYGAQLVKGQFLAFLDADDQWDSEKLARHRAMHDLDPLLTASFARVEFAPAVNGNLASGRTLSQMPDGYLYTSDVVVENAVCTTSNLVVERKAFLDLKGFDETMRYAEDQEFLARLIADGGLIRGVAQTLVRYRMSEDGLSCDFEAMLENWQRFASFWLDEHEFAAAKATYCRYLSRRALRAGAPMHVARTFARRGLNADRAKFLDGGLPGIMTFCGAFAGSAMPAPLRRAVFA